MLKELELIVKHIKGNLKTAQDRQKRHANLKRTLNEFQVGEHVFIKVKPKKISFKLGRCATLAPKYYRPFKILSKVGLVMYQLALQPNLKNITSFMFLF